MTTSASSTMCVEEVQALKAEVQRALLSLGGGGDGTSYDNCDFLSGNDAGQRYGYTGNIGMSLPAQTLLAELAAASRKRRQAETDLLRDMQRDEYERQYQHASYLKLCKSIASLRAMRQEIQRDMASTDENEWVPSGAATPLQERPDGSDTFTALLTPPVPVTVRQQPVPRGNNVDASSTAQLDSLGQSNQQYSIEGFITRLEPTGEKQVQRPVSSSSKSGNWLRSQDTLTDVFQLQLKFAETMLRLEESVQMRDRLLQQKPLRSSHPRVRRRLESKASRRNPIYAVEDSEELSDSEDYLQSSSDEYVRQRRFRDTSTTAQTTPTERDGEQTPNTVRSATTVVNSAHTTSTVDNQPQTPLDAVLHTPQDQFTRPELHQEPRATRDASSSSKQVRFRFRSSYDPDYATPLIARAIRFEHPSDDDSDSELSFLQDSSVSSSALNNESFLQSFAHFRQDLNQAKRRSNPIKGANMAATPTTPPGHMKEEAAPSTHHSPQTVSSPSLSSSSSSQSQSPSPSDSSTPKFPAPDTLSRMNRPQLLQLRKGICLDIQDTSAKAALSDSIATSTKLQDALAALRHQLSLIDEQLSNTQQ